MLRKILPHGAIIISLMYFVFFFIDRVNSAMAFINNGMTKALLFVLCLITIANALLLIADDRKRTRARRQVRRPAAQPAQRPVAPVQARPQQRPAPAKQPQRPTARASYDRYERDYRRDYRREYDSRRYR